jgi:hypothetical protein
MYLFAGLETRILPDDYFIEALRGERGVFATRRIAKGELLGHYGVCVWTP